MSSFNEPSNPYQSETHEPSLGYSGINISETLNAWRSIGKWQTFFSVLGFIATAIIAVMLAISAVAGRNGQAAAGMIGMFIFMIPVTILCYLIPSILLFKAGAATRLIGESDAETFSKIANSQKNFWRYIGILAVLCWRFMCLLFRLAFLLPSHQHRSFTHSIFGNCTLDQAKLLNQFDFGDTCSKLFLTLGKFGFPLL